VERQKKLGWGGWGEGGRGGEGGNRVGMERGGRLFRVWVERLKGKVSGREGGSMRSGREG